MADNPTTKRSGGWRYQPVYQDDASGRIISLCECYFGVDGRLTSWTESPAMIPQGETMDELTDDLSLMLAASYKWMPVSFDSLRVGMTFERTGANVDGMIAAMNMARSSMQ